jgi:hypothetical protein
MLTHRIAVWWRGQNAPRWHTNDERGFLKMSSDSRHSVDPFSGLHTHTHACETAENESESAWPKSRSM